jgi:Holliday junction resolvase
MESQVQKRLIKYLKGKGCYVIKTKPGLGTPVGCPDVWAFLEGWWGAFECKATEKSPFQPLQKETIEKLDKWSTATVVHANNIDDVISQLEKML